MRIKFFKYQGTGNDFVIINAFQENIVLSQAQIELICDRKFGVGADGLMLLKKDTNYDFLMDYFNADGNASSMCGNGGRCIVHLANQLNYIGDETNFLAPDGIHSASLFNNEIVKLSMSDVSHLSFKAPDVVVLNTGSPHLVKFVTGLNYLDIKKEGSAIRYSEEYIKEGINCNFAEIVNDELFVRTYERGVEDETLSCGTGVTASAIAAFALNKIKQIDEKINVFTKGGNLSVSFNCKNETFSNVHLIGSAVLVFKGEIEI